MLTVAYLANQFPVAVEPYVADEIAELRHRGVQVIAGSVARMPSDESVPSPEVVIRPVPAAVLLQAIGLCVRHWNRIAIAIGRVVFKGKEGPIRRAKALLHTFLGACYAVQLQSRRVDHIHVHHGFSASWIAMIAARLLGVDWSMTLHGSDLLLHHAYLDLKLDRCSFCLTVSDYNRRFILAHCPEVDSGKVLVSRLGVDVPGFISAVPSADEHGPFRILAVGRLHAVKDHAFLLRACAQLKTAGFPFRCEIAGEGPERRRLEALAQRLGVTEVVELLGHSSREQISALYQRADLVVLTSRSEGIPLVLMEAMARAKLVLAPAITGIPELVTAGKTGFLYEPGSVNDFVQQVLAICQFEANRLPVTHPTVSPAASQVGAVLDWVRHAARVQVQQNFDRQKNLESFANLFLGRVAPKLKELPNENLVLQQI